MVGLLVLVVVLAVSTAGGLLWRRRNGRFTPVGRTAPASGRTAGTAAPASGHTGGTAAPASGRTAPASGRTGGSAAPASGRTAPASGGTGGMAAPALDDPGSPAAEPAADGEPASIGRPPGRLPPADEPADLNGGPAEPGGEPVAPEVLAGLGIDPGAAPVTLVQFSSAFCQPCRATRRVLGEVVRLLPAVAHVEVDAESHLPAVRALGILRTPTVLVVDPAGRVVRRASGQPRTADVVAAVAPYLPDRAAQGAS